MHFCTAHIAIGGDFRNTMVRDEFSPVSWPEIDILRDIHSDESVTEIRPFVRVNQSARAERERIAHIYGDEACQRRWGGRNPPSELEAADARLPSDVLWQNPLTGNVEKTGKGGETSVKAPTPTLPPLRAVEVVGDLSKPPPAPEVEEDDELPPAGPDAGEGETDAKPRATSGQFVKRK